MAKGLCRIHVILHGPVAQLVEEPGGRGFKSRQVRIYFMTVDNNDWRQFTWVSHLVNSNPMLPYKAWNVIIDVAGVNNPIMVIQF